METGLNKSVIFVRANKRSKCYIESIKFQTAVCRRKMANNNALEACPPLIDDGSKKGFQEAYDKMLMLSRTGSVKHVYVSELSRLRRDPVELMSLLITLRNLSVSVITPDREVTIKEPIDLLLLAIKCYQQESSMKATRALLSKKVNM